MGVSRGCYMVMAGLLSVAPLAQAADKPRPPDMKETATVLRMQRDRADQRAADLEAELSMMQQDMARREANWREYSKPLWDKSAAKPPATKPGAP